MEVVSLGQGAAEGDFHDELQTSSDHQVLVVVGGRVVVRFVNLQTHVDALH